MHIIDGGLERPEVIALLHRHVTAARAATAEGSAHALDLSGLQSPNIHFFSAWEADTLIAVGALKRFSSSEGEIKSMHVAEQARRRGAGAAMLRHIIAAASEQGLKTLSLETGASDHFIPARALYRAHGFRDCPPFADYRSDPNSVFLCLKLAGSPHRASATT
jgi:putative acetyltransferase